MSKKNINRKVYFIAHDYKIKEYPYSDIEADKKSFGSWESNIYSITFHFADVIYYYDREYAVKQAFKQREEELKRLRNHIESAFKDINEYVQEIDKILRIEIK